MSKPQAGNPNKGEASKKPQEASTTQKSEKDDKNYGSCSSGGYEGGCGSMGNKKTGGCS